MNVGGGKKGNEMSRFLTAEEIKNKTYCPADEALIQNVNPADFVDVFLLEEDGQTMTSSFETMKRCLKLGMKYFVDKGIEHPRHQDIWECMEDLRKSGHKPATVCVYMSALRKFFYWLAVKGFYPNITQAIELPKPDMMKQRKDALTAQQFKNVLAAVDRSSLQGKRDYAMLLLMGKTGLRCNEVAQLNIGDIRVKGMLGAVLWVQTKGHTEKDEYVKLPPKCEEAVREYLAARGESNEDAPLFASESSNCKGNRLSTVTISCAVKKYFKAAGFNSSRLTAHSLRHTAVTLALKAGARIEDVGEMARHDCLDSTLRYDHRRKNPKAMEEAVSKLVDYLGERIFGIDPTKKWREQCEAEFAKVN